MSRCIVFLLALTLAVPAFAADTIEARLKELIRRAADGSLGEVAGEVASPEAFAAKPLREQIILHHGTGGLLGLVKLGEASPLKAKLPAKTWAALVAGQGALEQAQAVMRTGLHGAVVAALAKRDLMPARVLVGTANIYLRELGEAESVLGRATCVAIARVSVDHVARAEVQQPILALATDPAATDEVRERARHLYPLISETGAAVAVAEAKLRQELGLSPR